MKRNLSGREGPVPCMSRWRDIEPAAIPISGVCSLSITGDLLFHNHHKCRDHAGFEQSFNACQVDRERRAIGSKHTSNKKNDHFSSRFVPISTALSSQDSAFSIKELKN